MKKQKNIIPYLISTAAHSSKQNEKDMSINYSLLLHNEAKLKETCNSFIANNYTNHPINNYREYIINYCSPEILLHESFLNSQFALPPIVSRRSEDDE